MTLEEILAVRPLPGRPREYSFPEFDRTVLPSGMQLLTVHIPGRPLVSANLIVRRGAGDEPAELAGATGARLERAHLEIVEAGRKLGGQGHQGAEKPSVRPFRGRRL